MAVSPVAPSVSALTSYTASLTAAAKARAASAAQSDTAASASASQTQSSLASNSAVPTAPTALELAVSTTFDLEQLAARGNLQAQHVLDRRQALRGLSARPIEQPALSSAPERNVPANRSISVGTRVNTLA